MNQADRLTLRITGIGNFYRSGREGVGQKLKALPAIDRPLPISLTLTENKPMKRVRSDSATAAVKAAQAVAAGPISPPDYITLRDGDQPFWDAIVSARARDTWNNSDLENAANLARCKADIERLQVEIGIEGDIVVNDRGTQIINPKHTLLETLTRRAMALSRMLHVHAEATVGKSEDAAKALRNEKDAKKASDAVEDTLIPGLRMVK